jgi:hypothetical protein
VPAKKYFLNKGHDFIEKRRILLDEFAKKLANKDFLYISSEVQNFLKGIGLEENK